MRKYGINVPGRVAVSSVDELKKAFKDVFPQEKEVLEKSQVLAGGRDLGISKSGLKGGAHIVNIDQAEDIAGKMLGQVLVTKQTGRQEKVMSKVSPPNLLGNKPTTADQGRRMLKSMDPLPIPHCTIPDPVGEDLDFINVAHSHLIHSDWSGLEKLSSTLNLFRIKHVLLRIRKDFVLALEFYNWVELKRSNLHTLETNSMILHILTKSSKFKSAEGILRGIVNSCQLDLNPRLFDTLLYSYRLCDSSSRIFDLLFKTYAHMKKFRLAIDTFGRMKEYGFLPTVRSCNAFMSSLLGLHRGDIVLAFYRSMKRFHISPNVYTLNMVIAAYCDLGCIEKAVELFESMDDMGISPTVVTYNKLIDGYCNKDLIVSALKLKKSMEKKGLQPTEVTFNTIINGLCKEGKLYEANKILSEMKASDVVPNIITYNTLINAYGQSGQSEMGNRIYEEMSNNGVKADILTYNGLILGLCKEGKTKKAAYLVKEIEKKNLSPNSSTFAALIYGQCMRKNSERAFELYKFMVRKNFHPNKYTYDILISTFCNNDDFDGAYQVLMEMLSRRLRPNSHIVGEIYSGLCQNKKVEVALKMCEGIKAQFPDWDEKGDCLSFHQS